MDLIISVPEFSNLLCIVVFIFQQKVFDIFLISEK